MKVALANEMREIDRRAQAEYRMPGDLLMEQAALAALDLIRKDFGRLAGKKILIFCGKGNNGGDGLALARLLAGQKVEVTAVLAYEPDAYTGLAGENLARARNYGVTITLWSGFNRDELKAADLVVDALLGTGARGVPRETLVEIITMVNDCNRPVYALDLPSGIAADSGQIPGVAIKAVKTITFGLPQPGLLIYPGAGYAGEIMVASIGFPRTLLEDENLKIYTLIVAEACRLVPRRSPEAHKGTGGHLLVVGGAPGMTGAVTLAALGALRSGCGLVTAALPQPHIWQEKPAEVMATAWEEILNGSQTFRSVVIGPGMSTGIQATELLNRLLQRSKLPLVIDADALNILAANREWLTRFTQPVILTPHPGEMARLTGLSIGEIQADRLAVAGSFAKQWGVTVVLKGARTIVATADGTGYINLTGNSGMATAGMGDVLAGIIGSLICQGMTVREAGVFGTYLHGWAGDLAAAQGGPVGIVAGDVISQIPLSLQQISSGAVAGSRAGGSLIRIDD